MRRLALASVLFAAALAAGRCASMAPPIPLRGTRTDLERLAGSWWGDYQSADGRRGTIAFSLGAGATEAYGSVVMIPNDANVPYRPYRLPLIGDHVPAAARLLSIRFAAIDDSRIEGQLDPYWEPRLDTMATTVFWGWLEHDAIAGTFSTTYSTRGPDAAGEWRVRRHR